MPKKDQYHNVVRTALEKEGWTITDDPLFLRVGGKEMFIDLGAERLILANKGAEKIAVEVKSFTNISFITAFYEAIGQFMLYEEALKIKEPERMLFLAVPKLIYEAEMVDEVLIQSAVENRNIHLFVFDDKEETITSWIR